MFRIIRFIIVTSAFQKHEILYLPQKMYELHMLESDSIQYGARLEAATTPAAQTDLYIP